MNRAFHLDRRNGKVMGLLAGVARQTGVEAKTLRIVFLSLGGVMLLTGGWQWLIVAYFGGAYLASRTGKKRDRADRGRAGGSIRDLRTTMTETDRKLADIDRYVASPNSSLAREIDALR